MKKTIWGFIVVVSLLTSITQCKKSIDPSNPLPGGSNNNPGGAVHNDTTQPSAVGTPTGPSVTQYIGPSGGKLTTGDGVVEIDIPAGALPNGDTITIQNITNSASQSRPGDGYRFLPNGLKFAVPATLKFHYSDDEADGSDPEFMGIAYQDSAGFWKPVQITDLDTLTHTITAQTNHFTDFLKFKTLQIQPVSGDLIAKTKLFVSKSEIFEVYAASVNNVANLQPLSIDQAVSMPFWSVNNVRGGNSSVGKINETGFYLSQGNPLQNEAATNYTAPATAPQGSAYNPVKISTTVEIDVSSSTISRMISYLTKGSGPTRKANLRYRVRILDYNVYRLDIVDYNKLGCGNVINYYDSSDIFFRVGPDDAESYTVSQDSIENFPPGASPTTNTCNTCTYSWISEPIGSVNITSGEVTYSGQSGSYFVILKLVEANENGMWFSETCSGSTGKSDHKPIYPTQTLEFPMQINTAETSLDTLLAGTPDKSLIRLVLVKNGMQ